MSDRLLLVIGILLSIAIRINAQESTTWPPDTSSIFLEEFNVVASEITGFPFAPTTDDQLRIITFTSQDGEVAFISYPDEVDGMARVSARSDGSYIFQSFTPRAAWTVDFIEATLRPLALVCSDELPELAGEGQWVYVTEGEETFLCFTETDERRGPLPDYDGVWEDERYSSIYPSPDGNTLLVANVVFVELNASLLVHYFAYTLQNNTLTPLGVLHDGSQLSWASIHPGQWVSETKGILFGREWGGSGAPTYVFDTSRPNSLEPFVNGYLYSPDFEPVPPRYEYIRTNRLLEVRSGSRYTEHEPCQFSLYDASGAYRHELGYDCTGANIVRAGEKYLYVRVDHAPAETSTLVQLDPYSGQMTESFMGEIEGIVSVSPDGRLALLIMDSNGSIDMVNQYEIGNLDGPVLLRLLDNPYLIILDVETNEIKFDSREYGRFSASGSPVTRLHATWCGNTCLLISYPQEATTQIILDEEMIEASSIAFSTSSFLSGNSSRFIEASPTEQLHVLVGLLYTPMLFNFENQTVSAILTEYAMEHYHPIIRWSSDGNLEITLFDDSSRVHSIAQYILQVPFS